MTNMTAESRVALVTGASSGIGKEIARALLADGLTVWVAARGVDKMADLAEAGAHVIGMDIASNDEIEAAVHRIEAAHGAVDILVNNAGFAVYGAVEDIPIEDARYQFEVNLFGLARLTQLLLPGMRAKGSGRIVNISSMGGRIYTPLGAWYHATKHALEGWSDCLRLEVKPFGIDVVIVEPGIMRTGFADVMTGPLMRVSGSGAYAELASAVATATAGTYSRRGGDSDPRIVGRAVSKAIAARKPKTRYVVGALARPMMMLRSLVSDRMFDRIIMSQVK
ncbi:MAG: oxidoreductase [Flavobacteriaceae bacterium]